MSVENPPFYRRPLYKLLDTTFTDFRTERGLFDVIKFAKAIEMTAEGVYKWLRADKLSIDGAKRVVALSEGRLKLEDLTAFVFR